MFTILAVDDDPDVLLITSQVLMADGHRVLTALTAENALSLLESEPSIDLLLTDVVLPGMDGIELAARVKLKHPELRVIFTSGYYAQIPGRQAEIGQFRLIRKPWRAMDLRKEIRQTLNT